jgi:gamma-glutamylcysteine synthetase
MTITTEAMFNKYIKPTIHNHSHYIGIELENPIVNLDMKANDIEVIHGVMQEFIKNDYHVLENDADGYPTALIDHETGDSVTFDCSYNNLEFSLGKGENLHEINDRLDRLYGIAQNYLLAHNHCLTGLGVNPLWQENDPRPVDSPRYQMLMNYLESYEKYTDKKPNFFHKYPKYGGFVSASQVQLDLNEDTMFERINYMNRLEPVKAYLFANSYLWNEEWDTLISRDVMWEESMHGVYRENIATFSREYKDSDDFLKHVQETSMFCTKRGEKYYYFYPIQVQDYMNTNEIEAFYYDEESKSTKTEMISPVLSDFEFHRAYPVQDITARGTVEFRSLCAQPLDEKLSVAAFHLGLFENFDKLVELLDQDEYAWLNVDDLRVLRRGYSRRELSMEDDERMQELAGKVVLVAKDGLAKRGLGEETYLCSVSKRAALGQSPAKEAFEYLENNSMADLVKKFAGISVE